MLLVLLAVWILLAPSCTQMPTAPRIEITVVGRVVGPSNEPLPLTHLFFGPDEAVVDDYKFATTDSTGSYSVQLTSGRYRVDIEPPAGRGLLARMERVTVSGSHSRVDFAFLGYRVTGTVSDPEGSLLDGGRVDAYIPEVGYASSPLDGGRYSLTLPAGTYSFHAVPGNYWSGFSPRLLESVQIAADTTIDIQLGGILVSGKVLGPDGQPMKDVEVEAHATFLWVQNRTAMDGTYRLYVPSDTYALWFRPPHPFFIIPRIVGPLTITAPTSIDCDLSGIEWKGTVRRLATNDPAPGIYVYVQMIDDPARRAAAIRSGAEGEFRFVLEPDRRYDLTTYDPVSGQRATHVQGVTATADTTFDILIPPAPAP